MTNYPNGINVPAGTLRIAGTAITATAAEANRLAGVTAGTVTASKAVVVDANKKVDTIGLSTGAAIVGSRFFVTYPQVAAADVAKTFFIAPAACKIISGYERHVTVAGQAGVLTVEKLTTGEAPGAGDDLFATGFDMVGTTNVPTTQTAVTTAAGTMAAGDALCLKLKSGNAASYALGTLTLLMEYV